MKWTILFISVVIIGFIGFMIVLKNEIQKDYKPIQKTDSTQILKAKFDSVMFEISLLKKNDSIKSEIVDSLIKIKYNDKTKYIYLTPSEHSTLRLRLLATLDSTEFAY